jgi:DNA-binding CsgD family transcriptional regulator
VTVVGRDDETSLLDEYAAGAAAGRGRGVLVRAAAGCGLTTFLRSVPTTFDGTLLRARGRRDESHIPRAVLRELAAADEAGHLGRLLNETDDASLPEAVAGWLDNVGATAIVVDDVHVADATSCSTLLFAARRVEHIPVLVVLGSHADHAVPADDLPIIELGPLPADRLAELLVERYGLAEPVARSIAAAAEGVPLVALEVARSLDPAQRDGTAPLPETLLTHVSIPHAFAEVLRALPESTQRALCVAAADPEGEVRAIAGALATLGERVDALEPAEVAGVVVIVDGRVRFDHPLRRNVAYHLLAAPSRRAAHRALAAALDAPRDAERRATHLSLGVIAPDETVARDLELVAMSAERRHDVTDAARWWRRAAELSPDAGEAARRRRRAESAGRADADPIAGLTKAERRVAEVVGRGASNKEAAAELFVSVKTVDAHLQAIYRKLAIGSRAELAVLMTRLQAGDPIREGAS